MKVTKMKNVNTKTKLKKSNFKTNTKKLQTNSKDSVKMKKLKMTKELKKNKRPKNLTSNENELANFDEDSDKEASYNETSDNEASDIEASDSEASNDIDIIEKHKDSLAKLKKTDPEFYKFLEENDKKLLDFNVSDDNDEEEEDKTPEESDEENVHKPSGSLVQDSDESDFEEETEEGDSRIITLQQLQKWRVNIEKDKSNKTIVELIQAFHAALNRVSNDIEDQALYKVTGSSVFNGIVQLCVLELGPAIRKFLGLSSTSKQRPHKCKKFIKVKTPLKSYFTDLLRLLGAISSANILIVLLKHLHYMCNMLVSFPSIIKLLLKKLIHLWGTSEQSVRVIAFLCILRITHANQSALLPRVLKMTYMSYINNSKFLTVNNLAEINFMRRSLVELFALDLNVSYEYVFLYVRQLAIHLRNALISHKKENIQAVYNWQFVNSLRLWGNLFSLTNNKTQLQPLVYPFIQVCIGTIKLVPTAQYFPLRFHIIQILIDLSKDTDVFVNVLPFLIEVLTVYDFNKKHLKVSMKPLKFTSILKLSKSQLTESGFKDTTIETLYNQLLEYLHTKAHSVSFPELVLFSTVHLKQLIKSCNIPKYTSKLKQLCNRIEDNSKHIEELRNSLNCKLTDTKEIEAFELKIRDNVPPLSNFYEQWSKMNKIKKKKEISNNDEIGEFNIPVIKKRKRKDSVEEVDTKNLF